MKLKRKTSLLVAIVSVAVVIWVYKNGFSLTSDKSKNLSNEIVVLSKCVDGDTAKFLINGKEETVRLLGIDTPETVKKNTPVEPFGKEASEFTCSVLKSGQEIKIEYEKRNKVDKYKRKLGWIFVDGELLQEKLINNGYAKVAYIYDNYKYADVLKKSEMLAKKNKVGIWSLK